MIRIWKVLERSPVIRAKVEIYGRWGFRLFSSLVEFWEWQAFKERRADPLQKMGKSLRSRDVRFVDVEALAFLVSNRSFRKRLYRESLDAERCSCIQFIIHIDVQPVIPNGPAILGS